MTPYRVYWPSVSEGDLYFATAAALRERIRELITGADPAVTDVVIDMVAVSFTDTEGADMMMELTEEMGRMNVQVHLAQINKGGMPFLEATGVVEVVGREHFHEDISAAVEAIQKGKESS